MRDQPLRARRPQRCRPQQSAGFERGAVGRQLEQRRMAPRPHDLEEAEAVDRGALERLRQQRVERLGNRLPLGLAGNGRQVDADRAADAVTADCPRGGPGAG